MKKCKIQIKNEKSIKNVHYFNQSHVFQSSIHLDENQVKKAKKYF